MGRRRQCLIFMRIFLASLMKGILLLIWMSLLSSTMIYLFWTPHSLRRKCGQLLKICIWTRPQGQMVSWAGFINLARALLKVMC
jgi:hypothetical protein